MYIILVEILEGWGGGLFLWSKCQNGNSGDEGRSYAKFPPWWGIDIFWNHTLSDSSVHVIEKLQTFVLSEAGLQFQEKEKTNGSYKHNK